MDTIAVRLDERFDEEKLAAYLNRRLDDADGSLTVRQFGGGKANLTYLLDYPDHQYVLRRPPLGPVAKGAHDMEREYTVLARLHEAYPLAPKAHLYCDDEAIIGSDFFIMERKKGVVVRNELPDAYANIEDAPQRMTHALVDGLADLHAVDYAALGLADLGQPEGFVTRQIEGWMKRWHKSKVDDLDAMDEAYEWLLANEPADTPKGGGTLVHNDYKLDNMMLATGDPGTAVAVFDWDMCTLGDPLSDLGALLTYWAQPNDPQPFQHIAMMPVDERFPTRRQIAERYAARSGRDLSDLHFYHSLGLFRLTVILAQIFIRYKRGQTQDQRFAALGDMIPVTAQAAVDVAHGRFG